MCAHANAFFCAFNSQICHDFHIPAWPALFACTRCGIFIYHWDTVAHFTQFHARPLRSTHSLILNYSFIGGFACHCEYFISCRSCSIVFFTHTLARSHSLSPDFVWYPSAQCDLQLAVAWAAKHVTIPTLHKQKHTQHILVQWHSRHPGQLVFPLKLSRAKS